MSARCLIPAAGLGTRLRPVTRAVPKELLPVGTRPMLQWCLTEALEGGFDEIGIVVSNAKPALEAYIREERWKEGLLPALADAARAATIILFRQDPPAGVVGAVLAAGAWTEERPFAVLLPDNVRIAGPPPVTAAVVAEADQRGIVLTACHRVGPESSHYFTDVGRAELDALAPAGAGSRVRDLQERGGPGRFRAAPEGSWRLLPRYTVSETWLEEGRRVAAEAALAGIESDDVLVHRRLAAHGLLRAIPWQGTIADAGHPAGYLWAAHLLHEAGARERDALDRGAGAAGDLVSIDLAGG
ncbi:MAG TPA: sugar phosphate nucleotidyltransferase [Gemmatimonadota bacterium]|nr:sugar phosphate nucleotidyltransferase [Gemmatimonadota bacterium]